MTPLHPRRNTAFYNEASRTYSQERYPQRPRSYRQFFFTRRLSALIGELTALLAHSEESLALLDVGSADGVVLRAMYDTFSTRFTRLEGNDLSPAMVTAAQALHAGTPLTFSVRTEEAEQGAYDIVVETGVINYTDPATEVAYAAHAVKDRGYYIASYAGKGSFWDVFKRGDKGYQNILPYGKFEAILRTRFTIVRAVPVGYFVPLLWRVPAIAAPVQQVIEWIGSRAFPSRAHERLYILQKNS
jgi:SAM-dependent methyltransferase